MEITLEEAAWFKRLGANEQRDISHLVQVLQDWTHGKLARPYKRFEDNQDLHDPEYDVKRLLDYGLNEDYFFALYAIGSAITEKPNPSDTDLLLVTNKFPNGAVGQPEFKDLIAKLEETHRVNVDDKVSERYDRESDCRLKVDLVRKDKTAKQVDVVYQYDIVSPRHWEANDGFNSVPIFSIGAEKPRGYDGSILFHPDEIPLVVYRLSEARRRM